MECIKLILAVLAIIIPLFVGIFLQQRRKSEKRISDVVSGYMSLHNSSKDKNISALFKSGIKNLKNDREINDTINRIEDRVDGVILQKRSLIEKFGYYRFFQSTDMNELNKIGIENAIKKIKERES